MLSNLPIVMVEVLEAPSVISFVNITSVLHIMLIEALLHRGIAVHAKGRLVMSEVRVLEELYSCWRDSIS